MLETADDNANDYRDRYVVSDHTQIVLATLDENTAERTASK
jgi:hypothetical protein